MQTVTRAAVAFHERPDGRFLCVWNKRYGGWGMPGGLVEEHESVTEGLARELREETGLEIDGQPEKIWDAPPLTAQKEKGRGSHVYVFRVWTCAGAEPREMEVGAAVTWLSREEFLAWSPFKEFYRPMFEAIPAGGTFGWSGCTFCRDIQKADPLRHFRGCPLREPLPAGHPQAERLSAAVDMAPPSADAEREIAMQWLVRDDVPLIAKLRYAIALWHRAEDELSSYRAANVSKYPFRVAAGAFSRCCCSLVAAGSCSGCPVHAGHGHCPHNTAPTVSVPESLPSPERDK